MLAVVSDVKVGVDLQPVNAPLVDYYVADVLEMTDYEPFGMPLANRHYVSGSAYRFGFQGQEGDDEWAGSGNMLAFKYRIHDARLGRFLSVDPLSAKYPWNSPYAFSENRVIDGVELEGLEWERIINFDTKTITYKITTKVINNSDTYSNADFSYALAMFNAYTEANNSFDYLNKYPGFQDWSVNVELDATFVDPKTVTEDDKESGYWLEIVPGSIGCHGVGLSTVGLTYDIGNHRNNYLWVEDGLMTSLVKFIYATAHEFGHSGGLHHPSDSRIPPNIKASMTPENLMNEFVQDFPGILNQEQGEYIHTKFSDEPWNNTFIRGGKVEDNFDINIIELDKNFGTLPPKK